MATGKWNVCKMPLFSPYRINIHLKWNDELKIVIYGQQQQSPQNLNTLCDSIQFMHRMVCVCVCMVLYAVAITVHDEQYSQNDFDFNLHTDPKLCEHCICNYYCYRLLEAKHSEHIHFTRKIFSVLVWNGVSVEKSHSCSGHDKFVLYCMWCWACSIYWYKYIYLFVAKGAWKQLGRNLTWRNARKIGMLILLFKLNYLQWMKNIFEEPLLCHPLQNGESTMLELMPGTIIKSQAHRYTHKITQYLLFQLFAIKVCIVVLRSGNVKVYFRHFGCKWCPVFAQQTFYYFCKLFFPPNDCLAFFVISLSLLLSPFSYT